VLQLNLDSFCDHVGIFSAVIGHLEAEIDADAEFGRRFSNGRIALTPIFLISAVIFIRRRDFNVRLVSIVYYVAQQFYNSAQLWRLYFKHPPVFWKSAYILEIRLYFGNPPKF
jgi:hypothetical protein